MILRKQPPAMAAVLFVELPSANTEAAAGNRGGFFYAPLGGAAKTRTPLAARWRRYSRSASIPAFATSAVPHRLAE